MKNLTLQLPLFLIWHIKTEIECGWSEWGSFGDCIIFERGCKRIRQRKCVVVPSPEATTINPEKELPKEEICPERGLLKDDPCDGHHTNSTDCTADQCFGRYFCKF